MPTTVAEKPTTIKACKDPIAQQRFLQQRDKINAATAPDDVKKALFNQLSLVLNANTYEAEEEQAGKLRTYIDNHVMSRETPKTKAFCDEVFQLKLLLTRYWPTNNKEDGEVVDDIFLVPIEKEDRVYTSVGRVLSKATANNHFSRTTAYELVVTKNDAGAKTAEKILVRWPHDRSVMSIRDINHLKKEGVKITPPTPELRDALQSARDYHMHGDRVDRINSIGVNPTPVTNNGFINFMFGLLRSPYQPVRGFAVGAIGGGVIGIALGNLMTYLVFIGVSLTLAIEFSPFELIAAGIMSLIEGNRKDGKGFFPGFMTSLVAISLTTALITLAAPFVIEGLAALSLIASTTAAAAAFSAALPFIPLMLGSLGILLEFNKPGAMFDFFASINKLYSNIASIAAAAVFGSFFGLITFTVSLFVPNSFEDVSYGAEDITPSTTATLLALNQLERNPELGQHAEAQPAAPAPLAGVESPPSSQRSSRSSSPRLYDSNAAPSNDAADLDESVKAMDQVALKT